VWPDRKQALGSDKWLKKVIEEIVAAVEENKYHA
jgi:hypothetical protein